MVANDTLLLNPTTFTLLKAPSCSPGGELDCRAPAKARLRGEFRAPNWKDNNECLVLTGKFHQSISIQQFSHSSGRLKLLPRRGAGLSSPSEGKTEGGFGCFMKCFNLEFLQLFRICTPPLKWRILILILAVVGPQIPSKTKKN